jgi:hypothetical protein
MARQTLVERGGSRLETILLALLHSGRVKVRWLYRDDLSIVYQTDCLFRGASIPSHYATSRRAGFHRVTKERGSQGLI